MSEPLLLSPVEDMFWRLNGAYCVVVLLRMDGCIESEIVSAALKHLQERHPKLRAAIVRGADKRYRYHFKQNAPAIPFEIKDYEAKDFPWREESRQLCNMDFREDGPLAAITVLRSRPSNCCTLLLAIHHAIADGMSGISLLDDLLAEYARVETNSDAPPRPCLRAVSVNQTRPYGSWLSRLKLIFRFLRLQREDRRSRQISLPEVAGMEPLSQWVHWVFSREDTKSLVRRCRKEKTSMGGALIAAVSLGLMDCLSVPEGVFKCQFPINLRDQLGGATGPLTSHDLGCFVSIMNEFYVVPRGLSFWDLARRAHNALQEFVRWGGPSLGYNMAGLTGTRAFEVASGTVLASNAKRVTFFATNYGVLSIRDEYGSLRPCESTLIFRNASDGPSLVMEALVLGQRLNFGFSANGLEMSFWENLQAAVRGHLDASVQGETMPVTGAVQEAAAFRPRSVAPQE